MEIRKAELSELDEIVELNRVDDYENPDVFISNSIDDGRLLVVTVEGVIVGFSLYQLVW